MSCELLDFCKPNARFQGSISLLFAPGSFPSLDPNNTPTSFMNLRDTDGFKITNSPEYEKRYKRTCGKKVPIDEIIKEDSFEAKSKLMDLDLQNLKLLFRGENQDIINQTVLTAVAIDPLDFSTEPSDRERLYSLTRTVSGKKQPLFAVESITITQGATELIEGVDFVFQKSVGQVRFLTPQNDTLTVSATAGAKTVTPIELGGVGPQTGWMRALYTPSVDTIGDQCEAEFYIDALVTLKFEGELGIETDTAAEPELTFSIIGLPRLVDLRNLDS